MVTWILWSSMFILWISSTLSMRWIHKPQKEILMGVWIPIVYHEYEEVRVLVEKFQTWNRIFFWGTLALSFGVFLMGRNFTLIYAYFLGYFILVLWGQFLLNKHYQNKMKQLKKERGWGNSSEEFSKKSEIEYWIGGMFYRNSQNPKLFVTGGINTGINMGHKKGKWVMIVLLGGTLLLMVGILVNLILNDMIPPSFVWEEEGITIQSMDYPRSNFLWGDRGCFFGGGVKRRE